MDNKYIYFDFQEVIQSIREGLETTNEEDRNSITPILDAITTDMVLEDLPFYKEYLSKIDVDKVLCGRKIITPSEFSLSKADCDVLLRLVIGSLSSDYDLNYIKEKDMVELEISVESDGIAITKKLQELWSFQIVRLYEIYISEMLRLESFTEEKEIIAMEKKMNLRVCEKKTNMLMDQIENEETISSLDDLLNDRM